MQPYNQSLKVASHKLRKEMTEAERSLWSRIRRKQILGVQFYRQKPLGPYIVDFYCPAAGLVIEADGAQHFEQENRERDVRRMTYLNSLGLTVIRFDNLQVVEQLEDVVTEIYRVIAEKSAPAALLQRGENT